MLALLKGDLYRARHIRGNVFWYVIVLLVVALGNVAVAAIFGQSFNEAFAQTAAEMGTTETIDMFANFSTPTNFLGHALMSFGVLTILACFSTTNFCWTEMRDGFAKNTITAVDKKAYFTEKLIFALIISFVFAFVGTALSLVMLVLFGISLAAAESVAHVVVWMLLVTLITWACCCVCLVVLWAAKNQVIAYLVGFLLATGALSQVLGTVCMFIPNAEWLLDVYNAVIEWLPRNAVALLNTGVPGATEILGQPSVQAGVSLAGDVIGRIVVISGVMVVAAFVAAIAFVTKRDF